MKTIKSSLLLLTLSFSLGTFAYTQDIKQPCTEENVIGQYNEVLNNFSFLGGQFKWNFSPFGEIGCLTPRIKDNCQFFYPNGSPQSYEINIPGEMTIQWSKGAEITYNCLAINDSFNLISLDEREEFLFFPIQSLEDLEPTNIPTLSEWGLIVIAGALGLVGFMVIWRKSADA